MKLAVGHHLIAFALRRLVARARAAPRRRRRRPSAARPVLGRIVTGFTSMIAHAGGPPFQIYVMPQRLPRDVFVGTGAILFALINWIKVPPYIALGQFTPENLATSAALFPVAIASTWAGVLAGAARPGRAFYTLIYVLLVLVGLKLVCDGRRWR